MESQPQQAAGEGNPESLEIRVESINSPLDDHDPQNLPVTTLNKMDPQLHKASREGGTRPLLDALKGHNASSYLKVSLTPQKNTVLHIAVNFENEDTARTIIELCPSLISQSNARGDTPLHIAARAGNLSLTRLVGGDMESGPWRKLNSQGNYPIHEALKKGHGQVAWHLLSLDRGHELMCKVNEARESPLYLAAEAGLHDVVATIIRGPSPYSLQGPDQQTPLHIAVIKGHLTTVKLLAQKDSSRKTAYIDELLGQKDSSGKTALHYAASLCHDQEADRKEILKQLLSANPSLAYETDNDGNSPLLIATLQGHKFAIREIIDHCPDAVELVDGRGRNALHLAVLKNSVTRVNAILERSEQTILINERDNDGNTPIHLAVDKKTHVIVFKFLLPYEGMDLAITNKEGLTALDVCGSTSGKDTMAQVEKYKELKRYGAVHSRKHWREMFSERRAPLVDPDLDFITMASVLSVLSTLVATVTFAAGLTLPGGYKNDGPDEGSPVFLSQTALKAFIVTDAIAFYASITVTILLVLGISSRTLLAPIMWICILICWVAACGTMMAFATGLYVLVSKESHRTAIFLLVMGCTVQFVLSFWTIRILNPLAYLQMFRAFCEPPRYRPNFHSGGYKNPFSSWLRLIFESFQLWPLIGNKTKTVTTSSNSKNIKKSSDLSNMVNSDV